MSSSDTAELRDAGLAADADLQQPLQRVSYQAGMLLGLEATQTEQDYHRRHLNRHDYWLHGSGTVVGLRVSTRAIDPGNDQDPARVQLLISPGVGVDGLGREVSVHEPYCIDLGAWLTTQYEDEANDSWGALVRDGLDTATNQLWLKVCMRYQDCPSGLQPALAVGVNAGTDAVQPSRLKDSVLYELVAERPDDSTALHPYAAHNALPEWSDAFADQLQPGERARINAASGQDLSQLQLAARLLHAVADDSAGLATRNPYTTTAAELARTLLARVSVQLTPQRQLIVNPRRVTVDNLARPFLFNATLLAQLLRK